jgi:hypothetical protein
MVPRSPCVCWLTTAIVNGSPSAEHDSARSAELPPPTSFASLSQVGRSPGATVSETVAVFDVCSVPAERNVKESAPA